ncbi:MAG: peptidoglycan editing factor PgeF [Candidatus Accumulibacter sp.]|jgi:YfiH family protein|nr:peptidoglycan editing factor PgeF [Accumulibacter sp.]
MTIATKMAIDGPDWIVPGWPAPAGVGSLATTRRGGVSIGVYAALNLGEHVGDDPAAVAVNREIVRRRIGARTVWLRQVHGARVIDAAACAGSFPPEADAAFTRQAGVACAVMTADCLPVLFCDVDGTVVAAAHAGWRGLLAGVLEATVAAMAAPGRELMAWFGPAIGPQAFEVGAEVREAFVGADPDAAAAFRPTGGGRWLADIYLLARQRLAGCGVTRVFGGGSCSVTETARFFSHRRDGRTGRMASLIWISEDSGLRGQKTEKPSARVQRTAA